MSENINLPTVPPIWVWSITSEVCSSVRDGTHDTPKYVEDGVPLVTSKNLKKYGIEFSTAKNISVEDHISISVRSGVEIGDVLFAMIGTIGNPVVVKTRKPFSIKNVALFKKNESAIKSEYLKLWLASSGSRKILERKHFLKGTTQKFIPLEHLRRIPVPLAPIAEQQRIVEEIEKQFTRLDAAVAALKRVQAKLKRYRAALLKAACEGKLVPTEAELARAEGRDYESADKLLERILKERRAKWEADQFAKKIAQGKEPKDDKWKEKYRNPSNPDTGNLPYLPETWRWVSLDSILSDIEAGKSFKCEEHPPFNGQIGVVKISAVTWGEYNETESKTCIDLARIQERLFVREGDFLFSRANTIDLVGACVIAKKITRNIMLSDKILRLHLVSVPSKWILFALRSRQGRSEIERLATGNQESMRNIGQDRIRQIRIPLPPFAEQQRIVAEVERRLSVIDEIESVVEANLKRAAALRQSILKRAFEGKLVPQDPNDEPASVLLERIRAERARRENGSNAKKKASTANDSVLRRRS